MRATVDKKWTWKLGILDLCKQNQKSHWTYSELIYHNLFRIAFILFRILLIFYGNFFVKKNQSLSSIELLLV